jgi:hypothetical protein
VNLTLIFCLSLYTSTIEFFDSRLIDFYICVEIICYVNPPFVLTNNYIKILKKRHKCIWIATTIHNARVNVPYTCKNISNLGVDIYVMVLNFILICFSL